jgi:hypothetical protein
LTEACFLFRASFETLPIKMPREFRGATKHNFLSREVPQTAAWEGGLAYGVSADYSGGTAADFHGLPRCPCLQIVKKVYAASAMSVKSNQNCSSSTGIAA